MKRSDVLRKEIADLTDEMETMVSTAERENRNLTAEEKSLWDAAMAKDTGTLAKKEAELHAAVKDDEERARLRATKTYINTPVGVYGSQPGMTHRSGQATGNGRAPLLLRNKLTNELTRAIESNEPTPCNERPAFDVGDLLASLATGREVGGAAGGGLQQAIVSTAGDLYFIRPGFSNEFIDLARSASVCFRAGARQVPMETATLELLTVRSDPIACWRQPGTAITASHGDYGAIRLISRTLAAAVPIPVEHFEDAANLGEVLRMQFAAALGQALDEAAPDGHRWWRDANRHPGHNGRRDRHECRHADRLLEIQHSRQKHLHRKLPRRCKWLGVDSTPPRRRGS